MLCPICKVTQLEIRNNNYYCPSCGIFVGPVNQEFNSRLNRESQQINTFASEHGLNLEPDERKFPLKRYLGWGVGLSLFFIIGFFLTNLSNYLDLGSFCHISIQSNSLRGNHQTIIDSIDLLRQQHPDNYQRLCQKIDTINDSTYCFNRDSVTHGNQLLGIDNPACLVRGSKTIYLKPDRAYSANIIQQRSDALNDLVSRIP